MSKRRLQMMSVAFAVSGAVMPSFAEAQTVYTGATPGTWGTVANWSLGVPTATTDARVNNNAINVNVVVSGAGSVRQLTIDAGDSVSVNNAIRLGLFGDLTNDGVLSVNSTSSNTYLMPTGTITLNGTGAVELADTGSNIEVWFYDVNNANAANDHIINSATHTIRGVGNVGFGATTQITNHGLVDANGVGLPLRLTPNVSGLLNTGTLRASGTGNLVLDGSNAAIAFTNTGATIEAQAGATASLDNIPRIIGGTLTGAGSFVVPSGDRGIYESLTHNGSTDITNSGRLDLVGTIVNNGVIRVNSPNSNTYLQPSGTVTLNGNGAVELADPSSNIEAWFYDSTNVNGVADHIINGATHTIRGVGTVGFAATTQITNHGLIEANGVALPLRLIPNVSGLTNTGTLLASGTGNLILDGSSSAVVFTNTGANIEAQTGATVTLDNVPKIIGGTLTGAGTFAVPGGDRAIYESLTNGTTTIVNNAGRLDLVGTIVNNGIIRVASPSSNTYLQPSGTVTLNGTGAVELADPGVTIEAWFYDITNVNAASDHIINSATHTIRGVGNIGFSATTRVTNHGLVHANVAALPLILLPNADGFANNGTLRASNGGILRMSEGVATALYSGSGNLIVDINSTIEAAANTGGELGVVTGAGTLLASGTGGQVSFRSYNVGTASATSSGVLRITAGGGNAGTSVVNAITLTGNGKLDLTDHGLVVEYTGVSPVAGVRAQLAAGRNNGLWNGNNGIGSSLANNNGKAIGYAEATDLGSPATFLGIAVDSSSILLRYTFNGDTNLDGIVNFDDLLKLAQNYDTLATGTWRNGDFTYDGNINFDDLLALAQQYGGSLVLNPDQTAALNGLGGSSFTQDWILARSVVPEPTSLGLFAAGSTLLRRRR